jgi:hypothetical protein
VVKSPDFDSGIRRFDSYHPNHVTLFLSENFERTRL